MQFNEVIQKALSYYPELHTTNIKFITMKRRFFHSSAIPNPLRLFFSKKKRSYFIIISSQIKKELAHGLMKNLPEHLQIGLLGHELAHIVDYEHKNSIQIIFILLMYLFPKRRRIFERGIDSIAIQHGLGKYMYGFATHLTSQYSETTKKLMKNYLSDEEVVQLTKTYTGIDIEI